MNELELIKHIQSIQVKLLENEKKLEKKNEDEKTDIEDTTKKEIIKSLNMLNAVEINKNLLKVTKIGITVNKLTKVNNEKIRKLSESIVQKWKEIAMREKLSTSQKTHLDRKRKSGEIDMHNLSSAEENELKKKKQTHEMPLKKQSFGSDKNNDTIQNSAKSTDQNGIRRNDSEIIDADKFNDPQGAVEWSYEGPLDNDVHRDKAKHFLFKAFLTGANNSLLYLIDKTKVNDIIWNIENELYKFYVKKKNSQREYNMQLKSIKFNLGDKKNPEFNEKIYNNIFTPKEIAVMNSQDMASEEKKNEREKCLKESLIACQSDWDVKNILLKKNRKGEFQCLKCKGYETVYHQLQTRSSDEPMTTFVTCLKCNHRWKF